MGKLTDKEYADIKALLAKHFDNLSKEKAEGLWTKYCDHINFEEGFNTGKTLIDLYIINDSYKNIILHKYNAVIDTTVIIGLMSKFTKSMAIDEIELTSLILKLQLYKLETTFFEYLEKYKPDNDFFEKQDKIYKTVSLIYERMENEQRIPAWKDFLMDKNYIYPDGKRVVKSLDDVACALKDFINREDDDGKDYGKDIKFDWKFLQETFLQADGTGFEEKTCKDAVRMSNYTLKTP